MQLTNKFLVAVLIVVGVGLYLPSFGNGLFWDDDDFILHNAYIQDTQYLPKLFSENVIAGSGLVSNYWRPVLLLVFSAEWHAWGSWVPGWHMVNTVFHAMNAVLLFWILISIKQLNNLTIKHTNEIASYHTMTGGERWVAFFVALLFLIHPVQVEAVVYANSLGDSLSVFFMFVGVLCFQKFLTGRDETDRTHRSYMTYRTYSFLVASVFCYLLALMSKETAIIMPGLLALVALMDYRTCQTDRTNRTYGSYIKMLLPFVVTAIGYLILRATVLNFKNSFNLYDQQNAFTDSLWVRLLTFCKIIVEYVKLIFWPKHLHMERSLEFATSILDAQVIIGAAIIVGLFIVAWKSWKNYSLITFGILWFFIALVPTSNILVPINGLLYEHWLYVPVVGAGIALLGAFGYLFEHYRSYRTNRTDRTDKTDRINRPDGEAYRDDKTYMSYRSYMRNTILTLVTIVVTVLSIRTIYRIQDWRDPIIFYKQTLQYAPHSYRIVNNLAMSLANVGKTAEAIGYYQTAIELDSANPVAYHNLANAYASLGQLDKASQLYEKALEMDPKFLYSYGKLIQLLVHLQDYRKALLVLDKYEQQIGKIAELEALRTDLESRIVR